jgi:hypothetical protein
VLPGPLLAVASWLTNPTSNQETTNIPLGSTTGKAVKVVMCLFQQRCGGVVQVVKYINEIAPETHVVVVGVLPKGER